MALPQSQEDILAEAKANLESEGGAEQPGQDLSAVSDQVDDVREEIKEKVESKLDVLKHAFIEALDTILFSSFVEGAITTYVKHSGKRRAALTAVHFYRELRRPDDIAMSQAHASDASNWKQGV